MIGLIIGIYLAVGSIVIVPGDIINECSRITTFETILISVPRVTLWPVVVVKGGVKPWHKSDIINKR